MLKFVLCVTLFLPWFLTAHCKFDGERCEIDSSSGTCMTLSQCQPLLNEIKLAGTPMPMHMRRKLQSLTCGYDSYDPIICCLESLDEMTGPNWADGTYTMGVNNNDNKPQDGNSFSWGGNNRGSSSERPRPNSGHSNKESNSGRPQSSGSFNSWDTNNSGESNIPQPTTGVVNSWDNSHGSNSQTNRPNVPDQDNNKGGDSVNDDNERPPEIGKHRNLNLLPTDCGTIESDRIWGGNRTRLFEMPWMILISYQSARGTKLSCGGTLINQWYVLTAAHCVSFLGNRLKLDKVLLGEHDVTKDPDCERVEGELLCAPNVRKVSIDKIIPHPGYSPQNLFDDVALVRLAEPADFTLDSMKPICLPTTTQLQTENLTGMQAVVAGWGSTEDGLQSSVLLSVDLPVISNRNCQNAYNGSPRIYNRQLCAGGVQDKDSCGGDSGGPLMYPGQTPNGLRYVQRGIVSYGSKRCGIGGFPGVYTRVAFYMDWILDNIEN